MTTRALAGVLGAAAAVAAVLYAARSLDAVAVRGRSMAPALLPGDRLILGRRRHAPRIGEVVVVRDPGEPGRELIKRVATVGTDGVVLLGDNRSHSTDARAFGALPNSRLRWVPVLRYWPPSRFGPLASSISTGSEPAAHRLSRCPSRQR